ncbi:hypothetical protein ACP70R_012077 [Stipagrostis hirtigluma subsp. patula]
MADTPSTAAAAASSVELREAAEELDTATSAIFFDDDQAGDNTFSWPDAEKIATKLTRQGALRLLREKHDIPGYYTPALANAWPASRTPPDLPNAICVYTEALDAGMRLPLHDFYAALLRHYRLAPSQLAPKSWRYMAAFVLLCEDVGVEPVPSVFRHFFSIRVRKRDSLGWHHFKPYALLLFSGERRRLFTGRVPRAAADWKSKFFFLQAPPATPWPCPIWWGKPSRASVRKPVLTSVDDRTAIRKLQDRAGKTGIDVMEFLPGRRPPVGPTPPALAPLQAAVKTEVDGCGSAPTRKRKSQDPPPQQSDAAPPGFELARQPSDVAASAPPGFELARHSRDVAAPAPPGLELARQASDVAASAPPGFELARQCSVSGGERSATRGLFQSIADAFQFSQATVAQLERTEQELQASNGEVARLGEDLRAARATVDELKEELRAARGDTAQLKEELQAAKAEHGAVVRQLQEELQKAHGGHAAEVGKLAEELKNAEAELKAAKAEHADVVRQLREELQAAKAEHAAEVGQLREELRNAKAAHAAEAGRHAEEVEKARAEHTAGVAHLADELREEKAARAAEVGKLAEELWKARAEHAARLQAVRKLLSDNAPEAPADDQRLTLTLKFP